MRSSLIRPSGGGLLTGAFRNQKDFGDNDYRLLMNPRFADGAFEKNLTLVDQLKEVADAKGASLAQVALAWVLAKGDDIIPIPGTKKSVPSCREHRRTRY